ncbi:hypothetical protein MKW92_029748, partial [Papaver armeniacum]
VSQIAAKDTSELRRLRLILEEGTLAHAEQLQTALKLRTLFIHNNGGDKGINYLKLLEKKQFRVLDMQGTSIKELPTSIACMKHLRYLDLSKTGIEELPKFICGLYNLQTLLLRYCVKLTKFPETMATLKHMRYLDISGSQFEELPDCFTHLSNLQTLKLEDCCNIKKLSGNIKNMVNLRHLFLNNTGSWSAKPWEIGSLTCLQTLTQFKFPTWMMGSTISSALPNLVELELRDCYLCQQLPGLGQLPSLKVLTIATMDVVTCLGNDFYGDACQPFPELVKFTLIDLHCLEIWCMAQPRSYSYFYPRLEKLAVERCPKLECRQDLDFITRFFPLIKEYTVDGAILIRGLVVESVIIS